MKRQLLFYTTLFTSFFTQAQAIAEVKGLSFYEHHSTDMTGQSFGTSANGSKSGYDFVERKYYNSFNANTGGRYTNGEEANIDMVEHAGPFGTQGASMYLGFTAGVSSIWNGDIKGNGTTKWHKVAGGVNVYDSLRNYTDLKARYNPATGVEAIAEVKADEVYIGKIRNTDLYVMIRCTSVKIPTSPTGTQNSAFLFDYKFGSESGVTGVAEFTAPSLVTYPNPVQGKLSIQLVSPQNSIHKLILMDITGKQIAVPEYTLVNGGQLLEINTTFLAHGLYTIVLHETSEKIFTTTFMKMD